MQTRKRLGAFAVLVGLLVGLMPLAAGANHPPTSDAWGEDVLVSNLPAGNSNTEAFWERYFDGDGFSVTCTKYEDHNGFIPAQYDAAVIKDGSTYVRVYEDLTNVGGFTAIGAPNPNQQHPDRRHGSPHSWVMKCKFVDDVEIPEPGFQVSHPTQVCDTTDFTVKVVNDGSITLDPEVNFTWSGDSLSNLGEGVFGPFTATADPGFVFDGDNPFSTGDITLVAQAFEGDCTPPPPTYECVDGDVIEVNFDDEDYPGEYETREEAAQDEDCLPDETTTTTTLPPTTTAPPTTVPPTTVPPTTVPEAPEADGAVSLACAVDGGVVATVAIEEEADAFYSVQVIVNGEAVIPSPAIDISDGGSIPVDAAEGDLVQVNLFDGATFLDGATLTVDCEDDPVEETTPSTFAFTGDEGEGQVSLALAIGGLGLLALAAGFSLARHRREEIG